MLPKTHVVLSLTTLLFASGTLAANDWTKPCFGTCTYETPTSSNSIPVALQMWSDSNSSISDITEASGWMVLGCDNSTTQSIRLVCSGDEANHAGCNHLFQDGAEDTVVRLPEDCGVPFARVAKHQVADDQSVPQWASLRLMAKRNNTPRSSPPVVHHLHLDTNFAGVNANKSAVYFSIQGAQAAAPSVPTPAMDGTARRSQAQDIRDLERRRDSNFTDPVKDLSIGFNHTTEHTLKPLTVNDTFNVVNIQTPCADLGTLGFNVTVDAHMQAQASFIIDVAGVLTQHKITNFSIATTMSVDIDSDLLITASASASALHSDETPLLTVPIPGFGIPGILDLGPSFIVKASAQAMLKVDANFTVQVAYHVHNATFVFPPDPAHPSVADPQPDDSSLQLYMSPGVHTNANVSAHLTPTLDFGLTVFKKEVGLFIDMDAGAELTLALDSAEETGADVAARGFWEGITSALEHAHDEATSALGAVMSYVDAHSPSADHSTSSPAPTAIAETVTETVTKTVDVGTANATSSYHSTSNPEPTLSLETVTVTVTVTLDEYTANATSSAAPSSDSTPASTPTAANGTVTSATATSSSGVMIGAAPGPSSTASVQGCISANLVLRAQVGAEADFFGLFDEDTSLTLWSKTFQLYKKCLGGAPTRREYVDFGTRDRLLLPRAAIGPTCPSSSASRPSKPVKAVDEAIPSASIKSV